VVAGLFKSALSRAILAAGSSALPMYFQPWEQMQAIVPDPVAYHISIATVFLHDALLNGLVRDFTFAATIEGSRAIFHSDVSAHADDAPAASFFSRWCTTPSLCSCPAGAVSIDGHCWSGLLIAALRAMQGAAARRDANLAAVHYQPT